MKINEAKKVIEMSAAEYSQAMTYGTEEYKALREIRNDYPRFEVVIVATKRPAKNRDKQTMKAIKAHVKTYGTDEQKSAFEKIAFPHYTKEGNIIEAKSFFEIKKWFNAEFPDYMKAFEDHQAEIDAIYNAVNEKIDAAKEEAAKAKRAKIEAEAADFLKVS